MTAAGTNNPNVDQDPRVTETLERIAASLAAGSEADRYRALRLFIGALGKASGVEDGRGDGSGEEFDVLSKKVRALQEKLASQDDRVAALEAALDHRSAQFQAEQARADKFEKLAGEQRERLEGFPREITTLEDRLRVRGEELGKAQRETEDLTLKLQRLSRQKDQTGDIDGLSRELRKQSEEVERLAKELERTRADKDAEIERLQATLAGERAEAGGKSALTFSEVWKRLASAKPPLVEGHVPPTQQSAERMADLLVVLVQIVDEFDKMMRPFLSKYTALNPRIRTPWDNYAKGQSIQEAVREVLIPSGGRPVGVVNARLRALYAWTHAAVIACDATFESVRPELQSFLLSPAMGGPDPTRTIKQFLRSDGHELFLQHMRQLRSAKLGDVFGRGG